MEMSSLNDLFSDAKILYGRAYDILESARGNWNNVNARKLALENALDIISSARLKIQAIVTSTNDVDTILSAKYARDAGDEIEKEIINLYAVTLEEYDSFLAIIRRYFPQISLRIDQAWSAWQAAETKIKQQISSGLAIVSNPWTWGLGSGALAVAGVVILIIWTRV